jgi:hypothetical protein
MAMSTAARTVLGIGLVGLALVVLNQATAPSLDPALERSAVLASLLAVVLMLVGLLWTRLDPPAAARSELVGREGLDLAEGLPEPLARELAWGSRMLLTATPAAVVLIQWQGATLLRRGLLGEQRFRAGAICGRCLERQQAISLVDLRLYPGRDEFDALLPGLPAVVVQPIGASGLLVLGGWSPRCFSRSDLAWIDGWACRLTTEWAQALDGVGSVSGVPNDGGPGTG